VGTPRGRLSKLEKEFLKQPWAQVRDALEVKLLAREGEVYILARSQGRRQKERGMRRRRLKALWTRLHELRKQQLTRDELLLKLGQRGRKPGRPTGWGRFTLPKRQVARRCSASRCGKTNCAR